MVTVYVTTNEDRQIESINQSLEGAARHAYGMGAEKIGDEPCDFAMLTSLLETSAFVEIICHEDKKIRITRHFVAA